MPNPVVSVVIHNAGLTPGKDIIEFILSSNLAQRSRGLAELGKRGSDIQVADMTIKYRTGLRIKQMVEVQDSLQGVSWKGKIVGISHRVDNGQISTRLDIERPTLA